MRDWNCSAYGPTPPELGELCFFEQAQEPCPDRRTCETFMALERVRLWNRLVSLEASGQEPDLTAILDEIEGPDDLLHGD